MSHRVGRGGGLIGVGRRCDGIASAIAEFAKIVPTAASAMQHGVVFWGLASRPPPTPDVARAPLPPELSLISVI